MKRPFDKLRTSGPALSSAQVISAIVQPAATSVAGLAVLAQLFARLEPVDHVTPVLAEVFAPQLAELACPTRDALGVVLVGIAEGRRVGEIFELGIFTLELGHARDEARQVAGAATVAGGRGRTGGGERLVEVAHAG